MPKLILYTGLLPKTFEIDQDAIHLGRSTECDVHIDDKQASRRHIRIDRRGGGWTLTDLSSRNGTRVNGRNIETCTLVAGDRIQIGSAVVYFESERADQAQRETASDLSGRADKDAPAEHEPSGPTALFVLTDSNGNVQNFEMPIARLVAGVTLGRSRSNDISISDDGVSSRHIRVNFLDGSYFVTDLDTTNGTILNDKPITGALLKSHDRLQIGAVRVDFFANAAEACFDKDTFRNLKGDLVNEPPVWTRHRQIVRAIQRGLVALVCGVIAWVALAIVLHNDETEHPPASARETWPAPSRVITPFTQPTPHQIGPALAEALDTIDAAIEQFELDTAARAVADLRHQFEDRPWYLQQRDARLFRIQNKVAVLQEQAADAFVAAQASGTPAQMSRAVGAYVTLLEQLKPGPDRTRAEANLEELLHERDGTGWARFERRTRLEAHARRLRARGANAAAEKIETFLANANGKADPDG